MSNIIETAKKSLLEPTGISENQLEKVLSHTLSKSIDFADLYLQNTQVESWVLEDGIIKEGSFSIDKGVGIRAISNEKTGFAYSDEIYLPSLEKAANAAKSIAKVAGAAEIKPYHQTTGLQLYKADNPLLSLNETEKVSILKKIDEYARKKDPRVKQVIASLAASYETIMILNSEGKLAADVRPLVRINVSIIAEQNGRREQGSAGGGGRFDLHYFDEQKIIEFTDSAIEQALINLTAIDAPAGLMPVVLGPGWPGVLLHEAIGHGLEGDFNRKGLSAFSGRIGERVASPVCTVVDDGTLANRRGSLSIDDEGTPTECTVLIEKGILKGYMQDSLNAKLMKTKSTGNGRRESYAHVPMPRMTNTYMLAGSYQPNEIIKTVKKGLYAVNFAGGQVDITSGKFVFSASEAYLIENGKVTRPVKGATLVGSGPDVLTKVSMVGNDLQLDTGIGVCGKEGQSVPVGVGQPSLKIDELTVGGTSQ